MPTNLTWETTSDWDEAQGESGSISHKSTAQHSADNLRLGYDFSWIPESSSLEVFYLFDEPSGSSSVSDHSGNGRDGDVSGSPLGGNGILSSRCAAWGGSTSEYVDATGWKGITGTTPRTWNTWYKVSNDNDDRIISYGASTTGNKYDFRIDTGSGSVLRVENAGGQIYGSTNVADGNWHMLTAVFPSGGNSVHDHTLYVDGSAETNTGGGDQSLNTSSSADVRFGSSVFHSDPCNGNMASTMGWSTDFSSSQVQDLYNITSGSLTTARKVA